MDSAIRPRFSRIRALIVSQRQKSNAHYEDLADESYRAACYEDEGKRVSFAKKATRSSEVEDS